MSARIAGSEQRTWSALLHLARHVGSSIHRGAPRTQQTVATCMETTFETPSDSLIHRSDISLDSVPAEIMAEAERNIRSPRNYQITGFVFTHPISRWKAICDVSGHRYVNEADMARMLRYEPFKDPGTEPGADIHTPVPVSPSPSSVSAPLAQAGTITPRTELTRAATHASDTAMIDAVAKLAIEAGCVYNDSIAHNAGWFVPGNPRAYASPLDALGVVLRTLQAGVSVYRATAAAAADDVQPGLF